MEVSFREHIQLPALPMDYISPFREPFAVAVMDRHEMIAEKMRAMVQRGNPRDLYDLWFIFSQIDASISDETVARLLPFKFAPPLVSKGWRKQDLYTNIRTKEADWNTALRVLVVDPPSFDEALSVVERALRPIVGKVRD